MPDRKFNPQTDWPCWSFTVCLGVIVRDKVERAVVMQQACDLLSAVGFRDFHPMLADVPEPVAKAWWERGRKEGWL